jgi:Sel1 repeat-containing protein
VRIMPILARLVVAAIVMGSQISGICAQIPDELRRAAESGDRVAIHHLALAYLFRENYEEATRWYRRGAELGYPESQVSYAFLLLKGRGVARNDSEAFRWFLAAANSGYAYAYLATAEMYAAGKGTERDPIGAMAQVEIALKVLQESETQNLKTARTLRSQLAAELTPLQIEEALRRAQEKRPDVMKIGAGAQSLSAEQLYGCWRHEAPRRLDLPQRKAFMDLCFRTDGSVYQVDMAPEGGGDKLLKWNVTTDDELVINRQTCGANLQQQLGRRVLFLDTCVYMGAWSQICTGLDPDGFGCATK